MESALLSGLAGGITVTSMVDSYFFAGRGRGPKNDSFVAGLKFETAFVLVYAGT